jgi:hypothetical protein
MGRCEPRPKPLGHQLDGEERTPRHAGWRLRNRRMRLFEMINLVDMLDRHVAQGPHEESDRGHKAIWRRQVFWRLRSISSTVTS